MQTRRQGRRDRVIGHGTGHGRIVRSDVGSHRIHHGIQGIRKPGGRIHHGDIDCGVAGATGAISRNRIVRGRRSDSRSTGNDTRVLVDYETHWQTRSQEAVDSTAR